MPIIKLTKKEADRLWVLLMEELVIDFVSGRDECVELITTVNKLMPDSWPKKRKKNAKSNY